MSSTVYYTKRPGHGGIQQLVNQFCYIDGLGPSCNKRFPAVWGKVEYPDFAEYKMESIPYKTKLRDCLLGNPEDSFEPCFGPKEAIAALDNVLTFALGQLATANRHDVPRDYLEKVLWGKYERRLKETLEKIDTLLKIEYNWSPSTYYYEEHYYLNRLKKMFQEDEIPINNELYKNPQYILNKLKKAKNIHPDLTPNKLYHVHGDLHFDNIHIDPSDEKISEFRLIDPHGFLNGADIAYDIGKILHSCHGKYDFLHRMWFELNSINLGGKEGFNIEIWRNQKHIEVQVGGGGSGSPLYRTEKILDKREHLLFDFIYHELEPIVARILSEDPELRTDKTWKSRSYLMEALHFSTMLPFHIEKSAKLAVALYGTGVQLINEWCKDYFPSGLR